MSAEAGKWPEALAYAKQASSLAERLGNDGILAHTLALMSWAERKQGLLQEARQHGERSLAVHARLPPSDLAVIAHSYLALVYLDLQERDRAKAEYHEALRLAKTIGADWLHSIIEKEMVENLSVTA